MKLLQNKPLIFAAVALIGIALVAIVVAGERGQRAVGSDLDRLASIELTDYAGNSVSLAEYRGKPLVINAWAAWCPFCRQELPDFAALQGEFADIAVIAIDRAESKDVAKGYTDQLGISEKMILLLDPGDGFYKNIGGFSMPETIFVDSHGAIVFHKRGPLTLDEMKAAVMQYLQ